MQLNTVLIDRQLGRYTGYRARCPRQWEAFDARLRLSWLYHDQALEGVALAEDDVNRALRGESGRHWSDNVLLKQIRQTWHAIGVVQSRAPQGRRALELDDLKLYHALLLPEGDPVGGRYRKEDVPPTHYNHEVTRTPSISYRLRKLVEQLGGEYANMHPLRAAALIHHEFMSIWPFDERTGTAGRLLMNDWLMTSGYPPAIIPSLQRQEYFDALATSPQATLEVLLESVMLTLRAADATFGQGEQRSSLVA